MILYHKNTGVVSFWKYLLAMGNSSPVLEHVYSRKGTFFKNWYHLNVYVDMIFYPLALDFRQVCSLAA